MKKFDEWWMPDGEKHLPDHMRVTCRREQGRLSYQYHKYTAAMAYVKQRRNAVDIGAHIGLLSFYMSKDFETVLAFEPMEEHRACFDLNMQGADNVALYHLALGESSTGCAMETRTPGSSGDTQVAMEGPAGPVPMRPLDSFNFSHVDFIKLDCEGYEELVLRGALETLDRCKPCVMVEQKHDFAQRFGLQKQGAVTMLQDMGAVLRKEISGDFILSWDL